MKKKKASKPELGIRSMSYELYAAADGVSKSMLDILADQTPAHLQAYIAQKKEEAKETPAKRFGAILHRACLEPDSYKNGFHVKPEGMTFTTIDGKAWRAEHLDRPIITTPEEKLITAMVSAIHTHPYAKALLTGGRAEANVFVFDGDNVLRKMRLDYLTSGNIVADLKTCESADDRSVEKAISNYRYHVQGAYYIDGCKLIQIRKDYFVLIFVEKLPPYAVRCVRVLPEAIEAGRSAYYRDLQLWKNCVKAGSWPAWEDTYFDAGLPEWQMKQIARVQG